MRMARSVGVRSAGEGQRGPETLTHEQTESCGRARTRDQEESGPYRLVVRTQPRANRARRVTARPTRRLQAGAGDGLRRPRTLWREVEPHGNRRSATAGDGPRRAKTRARSRLANGRPRREHGGDPMTDETRKAALKLNADALAA